MISRGAGLGGIPPCPDLPQLHLLAPGWGSFPLPLPNLRGNVVEITALGNGGVKGVTK